MRRLSDPGPGASTQGVERRVAPEGLYAGQTIVFTGRLSVSRAKAADVAARCGFDVASTIGPWTSMLCVGRERRPRIMPSTAQRSG